MPRRFADTDPSLAAPPLVRRNRPETAGSTIVAIRPGSGARALDVVLLDEKGRAP
ncbi:hypothetical protein DFR50_12065 [Roseiarcus fermentans]|uniref:Uncharacterized protein n=1 Tax=Roseiarcus fermentans TaxID=1473586 RepID=A0A366F831_9HYPH|nr:hypothetical protein [Roseiarcus fermentans]RBP09865.1 hypothetical protein DFR50_12065 [Roseiarcus fermentans]